jgi:hypothetical protein
MHETRPPPATSQRSARAGTRSRFGAEVGAEPKATDLPETQLVLWRDSSGVAHAFHDLWTSKT